MPEIRADGAAEWNSGNIAGKKTGTDTNWESGRSTGTAHGRRTALGAWLKRRGKGLDLTQKALAEQVGCSVDMVREVESGAAPAQAAVPSG